MQNLTSAGPRILSSSKNTSTTSRLPCHCRSASTSSYGRTHVWKRRLPVLPNPIIPKFPQTVIRSDGTSFVQWTTSPRSLIRLTRDTTNNPIWNTGMWISDLRGGLEEENGTTGRMGRFNRKFGTGSPMGVGQVGMKEVEVKETVVVEEAAGEKGKKEAEIKSKVKEDMVDLTGMGMGMDMGMGGSLDDVNWYEDMASMTGGEPGAPEKGKKKEKKEKEKGEKK
ncbi:hypothetical protein Agabi119p4_11363 [Agaricus bisporus var. burnettii]|uniref:Uncharacterized protein n=1 Tax=Agaricus bisporus var. burnettii TaxID=192524 RepID=A0A8H7ETZ0_AGABI|nr:hypothetical protein Agabi119p4_11363 [Agaricus bisporus var. burnettii]